MQMPMPLTSKTDMADMHDAAQPGEILRDAISAQGWTVTEAAARRDLDEVA